jgi:DNA-directed RNA polymerase subunit H (RpoH/RPB5)
MFNKYIMNQDTYKIFKARRNIIAQLKYQGYVTDEYDHFTIDEVYQMNEHDNLDIIVSKEGGDTKKIVQFHLSSNKIDFVNDYYDTDNEDGYRLSKTDNLTIIIKERISVSLQKKIDDLFTLEGIYINVISIDSLQFNIITHKLVPRHTVLSEDDKSLLFKKYGIDNPKIQLPGISRFDAVSIVLDIRPGDVCEIIRPSKTAVFSKYYRFCS